MLCLLHACIQLLRAIPYAVQLERKQKPQLMPIDQTTYCMVQAVAAVSRFAQQDYVLRSEYGMDHLVTLGRNSQKPAGTDNAGHCIFESLALF